MVPSFQEKDVLVLWSIWLTYLLNLPEFPRFFRKRMYYEEGEDNLFQTGQADGLFIDTLSGNLNNCGSWKFDNWQFENWKFEST